VSSSGLIYAVIVGAWAAYLVPMWLRRQDELNEARPTERFSTAIRLLAGRSAMERRASRALGDDQSTPDRTDGDQTPGDRTSGDPAGPDEHAPEPSPGGFDPAPDPAGRTPSRSGPHPDADQDADRSESDRPHSGDLDRAFDLPAERRARLLARRRRMVSVLFLAFALGAIVAAVAGLAFLWAPAVPAALLTLYIGHLRRLERQRYEVKLDRVRAAQAAERLRHREQRRAEGDRDENRRPPAARTGSPRPDRQETGSRRAPHDAAHPNDRGRPHLRIAADPAPHGVRPTTTASALVEATDHEEWVDGMRERGAAGPDSWEPVPVPLPTYVTAPVAPRVSRGLDLGAPGTWNAGRPAEPRNTPLFDQYAEPPAAPAAPEDGYAGRPRAANE
jgi:hypothetical protein